MPRNILFGFIAILIIVPTAFFVFKFLSISAPSTKTTLSTPQPTTDQETTYDPTEDINYILTNFKKENKTEEETKDFLTALSNAAVSTENLDTNQCKPTPVILRIEFNKTLNIKNSDSVAHTLQINTQSFQVAAGGNVSIVTSDFGENHKVYPYSCDENTTAGVIWLSE